MICYKNKKSRCRCSTSAYFSRESYEELLRFIDNGGTVAEWDRMKKSNIDKSKKSATLKINIQLFAKNVEDFETIILPKKEYAHIMSEIATNITEEQSKKKVIKKLIGDYCYTVENNGFGNYRVIGKELIE